MKKTLISLALVSACSSALATETYNGRLGGMSNAGYATGDYSEGVLLNPSLGATQGEDDDFALVLNLGALASDKDDLIDSLDDLVDFTDKLSDDIQNLTPADGDILLDHLHKVDGKHVQVLAGSSLVVAAPTKTIAVSLIAKASGVVGVTSVVTPADYALIEAAKNSNIPFDPESLTSSVKGTGAFIKEVGISFAKAVVDNEHQKILVGVTPKRVTVETIIYEATVEGFDEDDIDSDEFTKKGSATSLDAGVTYIQGNLRYGVAISDIISKDFKTITTEKYELKPKTTAAVGYSKDWLTAELALDLNSTPGFGLGGDTKMLRAGVDLNPISFLHVRAGFAQDMENTLEDTYSLGLGLFDAVDLSVYKGSNDTAGVALGLGVRF